MADSSFCSKAAPFSAKVQVQRFCLQLRSWCALGDEPAGGFLCTQQGRAMGASVILLSDAEQEACFAEQVHLWVTTPSQTPKTRWPLRRRHRAKNLGWGSAYNSDNLTNIFNQNEKKLKGIISTREKYYPCVSHWHRDHTCQPLHVGE